MTTSPSPVKNGFAAGITIGAAALLFVASLLAVFQGISAIANDDVFIAGPEYIYSFDLTAWGWIHLILGIIGIAVSFGLALGSAWARVAAIIIASLSIIAQFLWLPYYPLWAILVIAVDILVIWAVSTWRTETL
ncbi:hypothetical protein GOEFS_033_00060 [Gordonia effusa NBRC 100432]|uniref:DUF7144 domain-containing protein n=1 Tax=Gordonia effusa NBRC 100432 TaxID=1077974 RepID=H0QX93_9ACTN|nr:hypothetical protein [Gordonia effusa]GAB17444.1 hypothetical protein GOEFS_033_00060 [Gordonia effusa NBRC 100432]